MELKSFPSIEYVTNLFTWGLDISFVVNVSITPEQFKEITGKDYQAPTTTA